MDDASSKLRLVLDYLPCEACLAQPVQDQELLCSICHRLHRQVAVKVTTRTTVLVERPNFPAALPVVIPPAAPEPEPAPAAPPAFPELEVVTEPYEPPAPAPLPVDFQDEPEPVAAFAPPAEEAEPEFDDVVGFESPDDVVEVVRGEPEPVSEPVVLSESMEDDYVFRPPDEAPAPEPVPEPVPEPEEVVPVEEIPVEPESVEPSPWAPPEEIFADEPPPLAAVPEPAPVADPLPEPEPEVVEMEVLPDDEPQPEPEPEIIQAEVLEEEVVPAEVLPEEPPEPAPAPVAPSAESDLPRLRGMTPAHEDALRKVGVDSIASLAGHDANELAGRAGLPAERVLAWVQTADLVHEVGVPIDSAVALVAAGVPGPRGLREMDEDAILDRVEAFGGVRLSGRDVKRWKRRA